MAILFLLLVCGWMAWAIATFQFMFRISNGAWWGCVVWFFLAGLPIAITVQAMAL